ncbi:acetyl-CoA carboxylase biotin carboxyl carrier protein [Rhizobium lusitanum]|uniref:Biotin carboxyl carrier protein of acetyl-CoA carboxylase n=1 Tax=Rhizobium lusitanum TaxID=293958 RepID=A0A6L9UHP1_9HYPH|nr:acetyl-CoA carboxylase biotin carboxyl carrier protein [Rhizobium lusitanum]NEI73636.1 acetyl-CoA carboxylase biotin carboxyl carrier protein [Rhizobium lusitanum]
MLLKSLDLKELKAIVDWVGVTDDVREFSLKFGDVELFVSRNAQASAPFFHQPAAAPAAAPASAAPVVVAAPAASPALAASGASPKAAVQLAADEVLVKAPMVGTFYAKPKPGAPDFVAAGDKVSKDTVLCIVEVMKLMNNIEAGVEGTIARILVDNEQAVEYGQPLMVIKCA